MESRKQEAQIPDELWEQHILPTLDLNYDVQELMEQTTKWIS